MTEETQTLVIEKEFAHSPEKLWRALTQPHLIAEWLMQNDFEPTVGRDFKLRMETPQWKGVIDCKVLAIEPQKKLSYDWNSMGLDTVVTFTLTPTPNGVQLRVEQSGFKAEHARNFQGAKFGWQNFLGKLEKVVEGL
jgi:uncharacterized protein YndB with AHSA1/START domain